MIAAIPESAGRTRPARIGRGLSPAVARILQRRRRRARILAEENRPMSRQILSCALVSLALAAAPAHAAPPGEALWSLDTGG
jgi:hypothetical protein